MVPRVAVVSPYHHGDLESALVEAAIALVRKYGRRQTSQHTGVLLESRCDAFNTFVSREPV